MDERIVAIALLDKGNLGSQECGLVPATLSDCDKSDNDPAVAGAFLRVPPFPGARVSAFVGTGTAEVTEQLVNVLREMKVGGSFWGPQPELPSRYVLASSPEGVEFASRLGDDPVVLWGQKLPMQRQAAARTIADDCDPWAVLAGASALIISDWDDRALVAAILGVPLYQVGPGDQPVGPMRVDPAPMLRAALAGVYKDPFTGAPMSPQAAIELCGFWRRLIDSNRLLSGGLGFAFWKQSHVGPLLWGGREFRFLRQVRDAEPGAPVAVWRAKISDDQLAALDGSGNPLVEVEDGFLRSHGLGADCVPPLSITVDRLAAHFDPSRASELELLLEQGEFDEALLGRARRLKEFIVEARLGKYGAGAGHIDCSGRDDELRVLVPGQVEDDRAVLCGGCGLTSNLELLRRVRAEAPDAYILYKPHPDVVAGHRRGAVPDELCLQYADEIVTEAPISSLIETVREVHVNTSLAGFEALLRGKSVTTYGVPFYAGWGLTRDRGPVPSRRSARRSLDELVAATLLLYPRYLDPLTRLPCPAEVVVDRLASDLAGNPGLLVHMRRWQGRLMRTFRSVVQ